MTASTLVLPTTFVFMFFRHYAMSQECKESFPHSYPYYYDNIDNITESDRFEMQQIASLTVTLMDDLQTANCSNDINESQVLKQWNHLLDNYYDPKFVFHVINVFGDPVTDQQIEDQYINYTMFRDDWMRASEVILYPNGPLSTLVYRSYHINDQNEEIAIVTCKSPTLEYNSEQSSDVRFVNYAQNEFTFARAINSNEHNNNNKWKLRLWNDMPHYYRVDADYNMEDIASAKLADTIVIVLIIMAVFILILVIAVIYLLLCKKDDEGYQTRYDSVQIQQT